jgi:hypothetical protein
MYKFSDNQVKFSDFGQPVGMKMNPENRWVKKAELIPWDEIKKYHAKLFKNKKGNVAKALRTALGALIIQTEYGFSDEETSSQIQETAYLQFFCGWKSNHLTHTMNLKIFLKSPSATNCVPAAIRKASLPIKSIEAGEI